MKEMDLCSFNRLSPAMCFWHERGLKYLEILKSHIRKDCIYDFKEVKTPPVYNTELWYKTGHMQHYKDNMFLTNNEEYGLKPMNCPGHCLLFNEGVKSYRDLPYRIAEFGACFRNERKGGLQGLKRLDELSIDDGHIFCSMEHVENEIKNFLERSFKFYKKCGFDNYKIVVATKPLDSIGEEVLWEKGEKILMDSVKEHIFELDQGGGAFYGPKIELHLMDKMNRWWQCGTIQLDFFLSTRLDVTYINEYNEKVNPIILHRATLGSIERFTSILLENSKGLPNFLHPNMITILPISELQLNYSKEILHLLQENGFTSSIIPEGTLQKKIRESWKQRTNFIIIVGKNEELNKTVTIQMKSNENNNEQVVSISEIVEFFRKNAN